MRALVTGANGFLGRRVIAELLSRGHVARAMVRPSTDLVGPGWPEAVEVVRADLTVDDLGPAFVGVDVLIHLAAAMRGTADEQRASTVGGTARLLEAMARSTTRRLVLVGSMSVYDWSATRDTLDEDSPLESHPGRRDGYTAAKIEQEALVRRESSAHGWALTVLRPGFIWGPGHGYLPCLGQKVGPIHLVIGPSTRLPLTYVDNCASCCVEAAENPRAVGQTFNVVDDDEQRAWPFLGEHLARSGARGLRVPVPYGAALLACRAGNAVLRNLIRSLPGLLIPRRFEARFKPLRFANRKVREVLGWAPPVGPAERLRRAYGPPADPRAASPGTPPEAPDARNRPGLANPPHREVS